MRNHVLDLAGTVNRDEYKRRERTRPQTSRLTMGAVAKRGSGNIEQKPGNLQGLKCTNASHL